MTNIEAQIVTLTETLTEVAAQLQALTAQLATMQNKEIAVTEAPKTNPLKELNLTEMETAVMEAFLPTLHDGELSYSETTDKEIAELTRTDMRQTRGVLGSLVKKGIINLDTGTVDEINYERRLDGLRNVKYKSFVHLNEAFFYLHPSHE